MAPPLDPSTVLELIERQAELRPEAIAITSRDERDPLDVTFDGLRARVHAAARRLGALGCARHTRVAVVLPSGPETAVVNLTLTALVSCVPLNPDYTEEELRGLLERLRVVLVVTTQDHEAARGASRALGLPVLDPTLELLDGAPVKAASVSAAPLGPPTDPEELLASDGDDVALVLHTSGSTAEPKIVPLTHLNLLHSARNVARSLELGADDVCLSALPLFHVGALVDLLLAPLGVGGRVVVASGMGASEFFAHLEESRPTWYQGVPTMLQDILHRAELDSRPTAETGLRFVRSVSAPLAPAVMRAFEERFGVPVVEIYGMTETAGVITSNPLPPGERRAGSVGVSAGPDVVVVDTAGNPAPPGRAGEVLVRGPGVMAGYEGLPEGEDDHFVGGWLRTGDEGYLDADGYLYLTGRIKEIINRGGEKIAPRELDEVALSHSDVLDAAAFAVPHETLGEAVALAAVPVPGRSPDAGSLRAFCAEHVARFKVPQDVYIVDALPRAPGGKLQRARLAEWCAVGGQPEPPRSSGPEPPENERQRALAEVWQDTLGVAPVGIHDDFVDLGGDSLRAVELAVRMSERLGLEIPTAAVYDHPTVSELEARLDSFEPLTSIDEGRAAADEEAAMVDELRALVGTWQGRRASDDSLLVGWNTLGARPPFFWGVQGFGDLRVLAEGLGADQPVWGMRSLYETRSKSPENILRLAGRYRREIERIQPEGPVHLGGYCAGGRVAFEIARQLTGAGREVATLCLVEHFQPDPYAGRIAYFFGVESGWHPFRTADPSWGRYCTGHVTLHPSRAEHVDILMDRRMIAALGRELQAGPPEPIAPEPGALDVHVEMRLPSVWVSRSRAHVELTLENRGRAAVPAGTGLFGRWGRPRSGRVFFDASVTLDQELGSGARATCVLDVRAPLAPGPWSFRVDIVAEGDWSSGTAATAFRRVVTVLPGPAVWSYLRERLPGPPDWSVALRRLTGRTA